MEITDDTALWYHAGKPPVTIRWVLVRDPAGRFEPQALLSTDTDMAAEQIVAAFVRRWSMETHLRGSARPPRPGGAAAME